MQIKDITGLKFNRLTALSFSHKIPFITKRPQGKRTRFNFFWKFKCDCGKEVIINKASVLYQKQQSCGCAKSLGKGIASFNKLFSGYKLGAKKRDLEFNLTLEQFQDLIYKNCHYCGIIPSRFFVTYPPTGGIICNGLDRIDSMKGYILDNCVPCCIMCNIAKGELSTDEFFSWLKNIYINLKLNEI